MKRTRRWIAGLMAAALMTAASVSCGFSSADTFFGEFRIDASAIDKPERSISVDIYRRDEDGRFQLDTSGEYDCKLNRVTIDAGFFIQATEEGVWVSVDYLTDINGDGALEVPKPAQLLSDSAEEPYWKIYWHSYEIDGTDQLQAITYHNLTDNWYLIIPEAWDGHFTVRQNNASTTVHSTTFYSVRSRLADAELLTIYTLTGTDRETQAAKSGRSLLRRRADTVYPAPPGEAGQGLCRDLRRRIQRLAVCGGRQRHCG